MDIRPLLLLFLAGRLCCGEDLALLEHGLNFFRVCCYAQSLTLYRLRPPSSASPNGSINGDLIFSQRPLSTMRYTETPVDAGRSILTVPLIRENGFDLYAWYTVCVHGDPRNSTSTYCFTVRPCDCYCYSTAFMALSLASTNKTGGLTAQLYDLGGDPQDRFPGRVSVDIEVGASTALIELASDPTSASPTSKTVYLPSVLTTVHFRVNVTLLLGSKVNSSADAIFLQGPVTLSELETVEWNVSDTRFWVLQPIRLVTPGFFGGSLKPLGAPEALKICHAWQNGGFLKLSSGSPGSQRSLLYLLCTVIFYVCVGGASVTPPARVS